MTAYNIVRMRVKPGFEEKFVSHHDDLMGEVGQELRRAGLRRFTLVKTGERDFCVLGEWNAFDSIVAGRPAMIKSLDGLRPMLEDLGGGMGVTDPVSGPAVAEYDVQAAL